MPRTAQHSILARLAAPMTAAVLAVMAGYTVLAARPTMGGEAYFAGVRQAIDALPMQIDGYIGADRPPLPAAIEMLRPNRLFQREYVDPLTGYGFTVLIVHCGDVRDMMGHYPPICYPSNGWMIESVSQQSIERSDGQQVPISRYVVHRGEGALRLSRQIANTFIVPRADEPMGRDDKALDRVARTRWSSGLGAAQVQIITEASLSDEMRRHVERRVAEHLDGVIAAVTRPVGLEGEGP